MPTVKAYLFTIARNLYRRGRCIQSRQVPIDEELRNPALSPLARALQKQEVQIMLAGSQELPELSRVALLVYEKSGRKNDGAFSSRAAVG